MAIKTYSYKKDKNKKLSKHFTVGEFVAHDGAKIVSDVIKIDTNLIKKLEKFFDYGIKSISIIDGYRTRDCSIAWGGGGDDAHTRGLAADISIKLASGETATPEVIGCLAQLIGFTGIGLMHNTCHVDIRTINNYKNGHWFGDERNGKDLSRDLFSYCKLTKATLYGILEYYNENLFTIVAIKKSKILNKPKSGAPVKKYYEKGKKARVWAELNGYYKVLSGWIKKTDVK